MNSSGGDVITLIGGNSAPEQVSGLQIQGSSTGNGIRGDNVRGVTISNNTITGGLNGVLLTNLSGSIAAGTEAQIYQNTFTKNVVNGMQITNAGSPPAVGNLDVVVTNNVFSANGTGGVGHGLELDAIAGATIGGIIGGTDIAATATKPGVTLSNTFTGNTGDGLFLTANGGTLNFQSTTAQANPYGIFNNTFSSNSLDGMLIQTTNNSNAFFTITNNHFGVSGTISSGNLVNGLGLISDSGNTFLQIGGANTVNPNGTTNTFGNGFFYNGNNGIDLATSGTANLSYNIINNTITNNLAPTVAPPHDEFTFTFNGTSGVAPFTITNLSDPGVSIASISWNLAGTNATIAATGQGTTQSINPVVMQPLNDTLLTALNGIAVVTGSNPLTVSTIGPPNNLANNVNTGLAAGTQLLPMTFNGFAPNSVFNATARFEQAGGSSPLTSAATAGSTVTVNFSNGLSSTQKLALTTPNGIAVSATGNVFGTATPGFGTGNDGIHILQGGSSTSSVSNIIGNSITGIGNYGIEVGTAGTANTSNVIIEKNILQSDGTGVNGSGVNIFSGGAMNLTQADTSTFQALVDNNTMTNNFNAGLTLTATGTGGKMVVTSHDNALNNNFGNGLNINAGGSTNLIFTSLRDNLSNDGQGSGKNSNASGGDNIVLNATGNAVETISLNNVLANNANGNGLSANIANNSSLNLTIQTLTDPNFTGESSFSSNKANGLSLTSSDTAYMHVNIYNALVNNNVTDGVVFNRTGASLVQSSIVSTNMNNNGVNGLHFNGGGSDPQDVLQQFTGTPTQINLINDTLNSNGNFGTGVGQGARLDLLGDSELLLMAQSTTFNNNAQNGLRINLDPGAEFGYQLKGQRSILDNVSINNNGSNGIFLTTSITPPPDPNVVYRSRLADANSIVYMQISSDTGNTTINNNGFGVNPTGLAGVLTQFIGGTQDIQITGASDPTNPASTGFTTVIQHNAGDGILNQTAIEATTVMSLNQVLVGGPLAANANGANGINFQDLSKVTVVDGTNSFTWHFQNAGVATLNVNQSMIQGNTLNGINLFGSSFSDNLGATLGTSNFTDLGSAQNVNLNTTDGFGVLNANITNSTILSNGQTGVNILLQGNFGAWRTPFIPTVPATPQNTGPYATFVLSGNTIDNNGQYGVKMEQNAGSGPNTDNWFTLFFNSTAGINPPVPFIPNDVQLSGVGDITNEGNNTDIRDGILLSNYMWLPTQVNAVLDLYNNHIQYDGRGGNISKADGVFIRVGTEAYLATDIQNNIVSGNVANDLHFESFVQYDPNTGIAFQPQPSVRGNNPAAQVFFDFTAQMDLRLIGNVGNTVAIQDPTVNYNLAFGTDNYIPLAGNVTPNGAVLGSTVASHQDPLKDNFSFQVPTPRLVQLFQVDNGPSLNSVNQFIQNGVTQNLNNAFFNGDWHQRLAADPLFPNPQFPQSFNSSPGDPFLP